MKIVVCLKQVPETAEAELELDGDGTDIEREDLVADLNEWDLYAVEEAVRLKEAHDGFVTVVTLGSDETEDVLRRGLAMGADHAIRIDDEGFEGSDALGVARGLQRVVQGLDFDLILTGAQSSDVGWGQVGVTLATLLDIPYASLVVAVRRDGDHLVVERELESNTLARERLALPALLTVQTGINEPRYVSVMGIRKVRGLRIDETGAGQLELRDSEIGHAGSSVATVRLSLPEKSGSAEILGGATDEVCDRLASIIRDRGGVA